MWTKIKKWLLRKFVKDEKREKRRRYVEGRENRRKYVEWVLDSIEDLGIGFLTNEEMEKVGFTEETVYSSPEFHLFHALATTQKLLREGSFRSKECEKCRLCAHHSVEDLLKVCDKAELHLSLIREALSLLRN